MGQALRQHTVQRGYWRTTGRAYSLARAKGTSTAMQLAYQVTRTAETNIQEPRFGTTTRPVGHAKLDLRAALSSQTSLAKFCGLTSYPQYEYLGYMSTRKENERLELLQGTLDLLILRTLIFGPQHGQGIGHAIQQTTKDELLVEHRALYPALQRLEERRWITAQWGTSTNNRKARFYTLT
jgi:PadR family transcriptional regulator, regulatory protein PadR